MPDRLREYRIPFAAISYTKGSFGEILSQSISCRDVHIWQHHFFIRKRVLLHPTVDQGVHTLNYMLQGNIACELSGAGKLLLQEGTYNLYYVPPVQQDAWLEPGEYRCVHVNLDLAYIEELAMEFHSLDAHLKHSLKSSSEGFQLSPHDIDYNTRLLLKDITRCGETGLARSLFLQARVQDLLLIYIRDMIREKNDLFRIDAEILEAIRTHMLENLHQPLTIASLSRKFGINQTSLRKYFKDYFQETIHHYLIAERMKKALLYLSENTSIHMTAMLVGYGELSSFTRAFKTYFGKSPSHYRKSQQSLMRVPDIVLADT
jgi:AraC-like DNA-binding protein